MVSVKTARVVAGKTKRSFFKFIILLLIAEVALAPSRIWNAYHNNATEQEHHLLVKQQQQASPPSSSCDPNVVYRRAGLRPLKTRNEMGLLLQSKGFDRGAVVQLIGGTVQNASVVLIKFLLTTWTSCKYLAVAIPDLVDGQDAPSFVGIKRQLEELSKKTAFFRMRQSEEKIPNQSLDFVHMVVPNDDGTTGHCYCECMERSIKAFWPKLRPGGVLAATGGHDDDNDSDNLMTSNNAAPKVKSSSLTKRDTFCMDGTKEEGTVRSTIQNFADNLGLVVSISSYKENGGYTWMVQKPTKPECVLVY